MAMTGPELLSRAATLALVLAVVLPGPARGEAWNAGWAQGPRLDPVSVYGDGIAFRVLRNGSPVGSHTVAFDRQGGDLIVRSRFELQIRVLFLTAYRYDYVSTARWRDGRLVSLDADIDDNGTPKRVVARLEGERLAISGPKGAETAPAGTFPTNHWHPGVLASSNVLNTLTGRVDSVRITDMGFEALPANGAPQRARRFAYSGDLDNEVWYDAEGRWVKMRFTGTDGSTIEYVCESCRSEPSDPA